MKEIVQKLMGGTEPGQRTVSILRMVFYGSWVFATLHLWLIVGNMREKDMAAITSVIASEAALVAVIGGMVIGGQVRKSNETTRAVAQTKIAEATGTKGDGR